MFPLGLIPVGIALGLLLAHGLRNQALALWLPRIRERLRAVFGPDASIGAARLDAGYRLHLDDVRLPMGSMVRLEATTVTVRGATAAALRGAEALTVESILGVLVIGHETCVRGPVHYKAGAVRPGFFLDGTLEARGASWTHPRLAAIGAPPGFVLDGAIEVSPTDWKLSRARVVSAPGGTLEGELSGKIGPDAPALRFAGRVENLEASLVAHLASLLGTDLLLAVARAEHAALPGLRIPKDLRVSGELGIEPDGAKRFQGTFASATSSVAVLARSGPDQSLASSTVAGTLSFEDADTCRLFASQMRPRRTGAMALDARLEGTWTRPVLDGIARSPAVEIGWEPQEDFPVLPFRDAVARVRLDRDRLVWSELAAKGFSGELSGEGSLDFRETPVRHESRLACRGLSLAEIPTRADGGRALDGVLHASASGEVRLTGRGGDMAALAGDGSLVLDAPEYLFLREAGATLETYGLPPPPVSGRGPLRAGLVFTEGRIELVDLAGRVEGISFAGKVSTTWEGRLAGRLLVQLERSYLTRSLLLALPAAVTGDAALPIEISGRLGYPIYTADLVGAVGSMLRKNPIRSVVSGVMDGLWSVLEPEKVRQGSDMDRLFDRILAGAPGAEEDLDRLIDTGISPEEVERLLADYRRRKRG
jgi:hypothetical protein